MGFKVFLNRTFFGVVSGQEVVGLAENFSKRVVLHLWQYYSVNQRSKD
jgi:hypothetical protein